MYPIFKKHIIREERYLLPIINKAKRIRVNDKYLETQFEEFDPDTFQLPNDVTCLEFKRHILLIVDQFRNQKGTNKNRKIIIFVKIKAQREGQETHCEFREIDDDEKVKYLLFGSNILSYLLGIQEYKNIDLNKEHKEILYFCAANNTHIKWGINTTTGEDIDRIDDKFYIITKKESIAINLPKYEKKYFEDYIWVLREKLIVEMYQSLTYLKVNKLER